MEIVEVIWALVQGCGCILELLTAVGWVGAGGAGIRAREKFKERSAADIQRAAREQEGGPSFAQERDQETISYERAMWLFLALLVLALVLTFLTLWKWQRVQ